MSLQYWLVSNKYINKSYRATLALKVTLSCQVEVILLFRHNMASVSSVCLILCRSLSLSLSHTLLLYL